MGDALPARRPRQQTNKRTGKHVAAGSRHIPQVQRETQAEKARRRTKVWNHPERRLIESSLVLRSAYWVEKWLEYKYPAEIDGVAQPENEPLRIKRQNLIRYRDSYLLPEIEKVLGKTWEEPFNDDSPLADILPPRAPKADTRWQLEGMRIAVEAQEWMIRKLIAQDEEMGMTSQQTMDAIAQLSVLNERHLNACIRLGIEGYEEAAKRIDVQQKVDMEQTIEQRSVNVNVEAHLGRSPEEPEKFEMARELLRLSPEQRMKLLGMEPPPPPDEAEIVDGTYEEGERD